MRSQAIPTSRFHIPQGLSNFIVMAKITNAHKVAVAENRMFSITFIESLSSVEQGKDRPH
jgi:hypothetical protein